MNKGRERNERIKERRKGKERKLKESSKARTNGRKDGRKSNEGIKQGRKGEERELNKVAEQEIMKGRKKK